MPEDMWTTIRERARKGYDRGTVLSRVMDDATSRRAVAAAREVANAASHLASDAARLARIFQEHDGNDASVAASEAAVRAAQVVFRFEDEEKDGRVISLETALEGALHASLASLEAATASLNATRAALDATAALRRDASAGRR